MVVVPIRGETLEAEPLPREAATLDLETLRTFLAIVDTGNFQRAARAVFRTPSAVSLQMKKLEEQIQKPLFLKDGRTVTLTPEGEVLSSYARRLLALADETVFRFRAPGQKHHIAIGITNDYAIQLLPDIVARLAISHSDIDLELVCMSSAELLARLEENAVDFALVTAGQGQRPGQVIYREPLVWVSRPGSAAHLSRPLVLAVGRVTCPWRRAIVDALDRAGIPYRIGYTSAEHLGQIAAVLSGSAIAALPQMAVMPGLEVIGPQSGLPELNQCEIELRRSLSASGPFFDALAAQIAHTSA